jgi:hypothetical protein
MYASKSSTLVEPGFNRGLLQRDEFPILRTE